MDLNSWIHSWIELASGQAVPLAFHQALQIIDSMEIADDPLDLVGAEDIDPNGFGTWQDFLITNFTNTNNNGPIRLGLGDGFQRLVVTDVSPGIYGSTATNSQFDLITTTEFWSDAFASVLTTGALTLVVSDNLNNWLDALLIGRGNLVSDTLVLAD